jgi:hypothetical protein
VVFASPVRFARVSESSICLDVKSNKKIKPEYFYPKNHRTHFPIVTPAARGLRSTRGSMFRFDSHEIQLCNLEVDKL